MMGYTPNLKKSISFDNLDMIPDTICIISSIDSDIASINIGIYHKFQSTDLLLNLIDSCPSPGYKSIEERIFTHARNCSNME